MTRLTRRELLGSAGLVAGTGFLGGCHGQSQASTKPEAGEPRPPAKEELAKSCAWGYAELDPALVADKAYQRFPEGGCMYAVAGSIVSTLGDLLGEPYRSFPLGMMRYGAGGTGGWGSLCGGLNGAAAIIGLLHQDKEDKQRANLIRDVFVWYETTPLPKYRPKDVAELAEIPSSVAGSVLCHVSASHWCEVSGNKAFSKEQKERCRRLSCDVVAKTVELLNRDLTGSCTFAELTPDVKSCIECHGKDERADAMGKMSCSTCHTFSKGHP